MASTSCATLRSIRTALHPISPQAAIAFHLGFPGTGVGRGRTWSPKLRLFVTFRREMWNSRFSMVLDLHSGFGTIDRLWFPYAHTKKTFPLAGEMFALKELLNRTLPQNIYSLEPQARHYNAHGDLWDYLFLEHSESHPGNFFIPLCLEMGSWSWIRKNPKQIFNAFGLFHPMIQHRFQRTLRRHIFLLDFLVRASISHAHWTHLPESERKKYFLLATKLWY